MSLYTLLTTNVALPLFSPGDEAADLVAFDNQDRLSIQGYIDDTVVPAAAGPTVAYYRWYVDLLTSGANRSLTVLVQVHLPDILHRLQIHHTHVGAWRRQTTESVLLRC